MAEKVLVIVIVSAVVLVVVRGLWRATSAQSGTGCPCCDKHLGDGHAHDETAGDNPGPGTPAPKP